MTHRLPSLSPLQNIALALALAVATTFRGSAATEAGFAAPVNYQNAGGNIQRVVADLTRDTNGDGKPDLTDFNGDGKPDVAVQPASSASRV